MTHAGAGHGITVAYRRHFCIWVHSHPSLERLPAEGSSFSLPSDPSPTRSTLATMLRLAPSTRPAGNRFRLVACETGGYLINARSNAR